MTRKVLTDEKIEMIRQNPHTPLRNAEDDQVYARVQRSFF